MAETARPPVRRRVAAFLALASYLAAIAAILVLLIEDIPALLGAWT